MKNKNYIKISFLILLVTIFTACTKNKVEPSKATYLPTLTLNGASTIVVEEGSSYDELGAIAKENGNPIEVTIVGAVDPNTPAVYPITYTATNVDGFKVSANRTVVVYPADAIVADGVVGNFTLATPARPSPVPTMSISNIAPNVYACTNVYGSNGSNAVIMVAAYLYTTDGVVYNILDASLIGGNIASGGTATWNSVTKKLACVFQIASVGPGSNFGRTWQQN